jgi:hypothetical protein
LPTATDAERAKVVAADARRAHRLGDHHAVEVTRISGTIAEYVAVCLPAFAHDTVRRDG